MATERAIDKLKKAFSVDNKSSYEIYKNGQKLFIEADKPSLRREIPLAVLLELMTKMQEVSEEATPDAVKSTT